MKIVIFIFVLLSGNIIEPARAAHLPVSILAQVVAQGAHQADQYTLAQEQSRKTYTLTLQKKGQKQISKQITRVQAEAIRNEVTQIVWDSEYGKNAHPKKCTAYAKVISGNDKSTVCVENSKMTGMTYGLLNAMSELF